LPSATLIGDRPLKAITKIQEDDEVKRLQKQLYNLKAERRYSILESYMKLGFTRAEAMSLMLQDIASGKFVPNVADLVSVKKTQK